MCLLLAGVKIAWTRWSVQVRVWLYSKGVTWAKERDVDREKRFDAFLSFSHKDSNFVIEEIVHGKISIIVVGRKGQLWAIDKG